MDQQISEFIIVLYITMYTIEDRRLYMYDCTYVCGYIGSEGSNDVCEKFVFN